MNIEKNSKITVAIKVKPNAKEDKILLFEEINGKVYLKISVKAPPQDGKANNAIIKLFAKNFGLRRENLEILRGTTSSLKILEIKKIDVASLNKLFSPYMNIEK